MLSNVLGVSPVTSSSFVARACTVSITATHLEDEASRHHHYQIGLQACEAVHCKVCIIFENAAYLIVHHLCIFDFLVQLDLHQQAAVAKRAEVQ